MWQWTRQVLRGWHNVGTAWDQFYEPALALETKAKAQEFRGQGSWLWDQLQDHGSGPQHRGQGNKAVGCLIRRV